MWVSDLRRCKVGLQKKRMSKESYLGSSGSERIFLLPNGSLEGETSKSSEKEEDEEEDVSSGVDNARLVCGSRGGLGEEFEAELES